jgi:hypothetical protein
MRIAYVNLIDDIAASAFTVLGAAAGYPIENVQDQRLSVKWRDTAATARTVIIDLGAAQTVNTAAIMGHNLSASAATTIAGGTSASVFATAESITWNAEMMLKYFTDQSYRYWKFTIDDPTNPAAYVETGRLWLGTYLTIDPSSLLDFKVVKRRSDMVTFGKNRQKYATPGEGWRRFEFSFPATGGSMLTAIQTMYDAVGIHSALVFCNFDTDVSYPLVYPVYASIEGDLSFTHDKRQRYSWGLILEECK